MLRFLNSSFCLLVTVTLLAACSVAPQTDRAAEGDVIIPANVEARYTKLLDEARQGNADAALAGLQEFIAEYPDYPGAYLTQAQLLYGAGETDQAIETLKRALLIDSGYAPAHNQLGIIFRDQGEFDRAAEAYQSAIRVNPDYALAYLNLGVLEDLYRQQPEAALNYYLQYRELLPEGTDDAEVDRWIADLQRRTGAPRTTRSEQ